MRQSQLCTKTRKEPPSNEEAKNAQLLIQAGYIHKEMAGVYDFLPLGLRVRENLKEIIREEMNSVGGQELSLTSLQKKEIWQATGRWGIADDELWFKTQLASGGEIGLAWSHEDPLTALMTQHISSYTDLPQAVYQFQTKLRNELRAKSGIMRGREFMMKDLYSFSKSQEEHETFYEKMKSAYENIFDRVSLSDITYFTHAGAGAFSDNISHEFQTVCEVGEDIIFISDDRDIAINQEMMSEETLDAFNLKRDNLRKEPAVEVGNIFPLGTKYSEPLGLTFKNENGEEKPVIMGSYGIGVGRLMGTVVEIMADEAGLVWPKALAPFDAHLLALGDGAVSDRAGALYKTLTKKGIDVLYDDRSVGAGEKFADADLVGIPNRLVISENTIAEEKVEIKKRTEDEEHLVTEAALLDRLS
jgi:prolyl-tRNA synthetase